MLLRNKPHIGGRFFDGDTCLDHKKASKHHTGVLAFMCAAALAYEFTGRWFGVPLQPLAQDQSV